MTDTTIIYAILGAVAVAAVLQYKGYISLPLPGHPVDRPSNAPAAEVRGVGESKPLFRQAVRAAMLEAQDAAADKIAEGLRDQVVGHLASPFAGSTPPAAAPASPPAS